MGQVILRKRFARGIQKEQTDKKGWAVVPDLILIDGGRGHLNAILRVMADLGISSIPIAGIAKENEEIFIPESTKAIILPRNSHALYLLQRIRDEAHRFAISYHTKIHKKATLSARIDDIPGIGPKRKRALIKRFGSIKGVKEATLEEISAVSGMNLSLAEQVKVNL